MIPLDLDAHWGVNFCVERNADWDGGWVLRFPDRSIAIAALYREQQAAVLSGVTDSTGGR